MNEPLDSRPQQTVNRLRLGVFIPALIAVVGLGLLGVKLAERFNALKETPAQDYPPNPAARSGSPGRPLVSAATLPKARTRTEGETNTPATVPTATAEVTPGRNAVEPAASLVTPTAPPSPGPESNSGGVLAGAVPVMQGIVGRVFLRGSPTPEKEIPMDPSCGKLSARALKTRFYVVGTNGGLADVWVGLKEVPFVCGEPPAQPLEIRQRGCEYLPYVSAVQVGQTIRVFNDDPLLHNVHSVPVADGNRESNRAQLPTAAPLDFSFRRPESFLRFKSDVHPWMFAYVSIVEHPFFAVSAADGQFAIPAPPAGNYTLQFTHRKAGGKSVPVKVQAGKRLVVMVTLDLSDHARSAVIVTEE